MKTDNAAKQQRNLLTSPLTHEQFDGNALTSKKYKSNLKKLREDLKIN
jgi:hypothetical protein